MDKRFYLFGLIFLISISSIYALTFNSPILNQNVSSSILINISKNGNYNITNLNISLYNLTSLQYYLLNYNLQLYNKVTGSYGFGCQVGSTNYNLVGNVSFNTNVYQVEESCTSSPSGNCYTYIVWDYNDNTSVTASTYHDTSNVWIEVNPNQSKIVRSVEYWSCDSYSGNRVDYGYNASYYDSSPYFIYNLTNLYNYNLSISQYYLKVNAYNYSLNQISSTNSSLFNVIYNALLNVSAKDYLLNPISTFNYNLTDLTDNSSRYFSTSSYASFSDIIRSRVYQLFFNVTSYTSIYINTTVVSSYGALSQILYPSNSFFFTIRDSLGNIITSPITSVLVQGASGSYSASGSGTINLINLLPGSYTVFANNANYSQGQLYLTVNSGTQLVNIYLLNGSAILFNTHDLAGNVLSGVVCRGRSYINGSLVEVMSAISDVSGKLQFTGAPSVYYDFNCSLNGYANTFMSFPQLLYSSYDVPMSIISSGNIQPSAYASFTPSNFKKNMAIPFNIQFFSPYSSLLNYSYNVTYPLGSVAGSGSNVKGSTLTNTFNINSTGQVIVYYQWYLNNGVYQNFTQTFNIVNVLSTHTINSQSPNNFGMLIGDKVLRDSIIIMMMMGLGWLAFGFFGSLASGGFTLMILLDTGAYTSTESTIFIGSAIVMVLLIIFRGRQ